jgi:hypothetical protein
MDTSRGSCSVVGGVARLVMPSEPAGLIMAVIGSIVVLAIYRVAVGRRRVSRWFVRSVLGIRPVR